VFRFLIEEREEEAGEPVRRWSGLLFAAAALTRPEGAVYFAMAALWRFGKLLPQWVRTRKSASRSLSLRGSDPDPSPLSLRGSDPDEAEAISIPPKSTLTQALRRDLEGIVMFSVPFAAWLLWKTAYYGDILPNTFYIKTSGFRMVSRGGWDLANYLDTTKMYVLVPLMLLGCLADLRYFRERWGRPRSGVSMSFLLMICAATVLYFVWIGGDFMELARFLVPALPFAALLSQEGIFLLFNIAGAGRRRVGFYALVLKWVFFFIIISFFGFYGQLQLAGSAYAMTDHSKGGTDSIGYLKKATGQWEIVAAYLKDDAKKQGLTGKVTVATSAAGVIPYLTGFVTLDLLGLNDPLIPRLKLTAGNRPGHMVGADWNYIMLWHADYFIGHPEIDPRPKTLTQFDLGFMKNLGYVRRVAAPPGLDPPYFSYWVRED
jgi:hypothetical protein